MILQLQPGTVEQAASIVLEWLGRDWVERELSKLPQPPGKALLSLRLRAHPPHPMVVLAGRAGDWKAALEAGQLPPDPDLLFQLVLAAFIVEGAAGLPGGQSYLDDLRDNYVRCRPSRTNIQHFWSHLFEAEVALHWRQAGVLAGFGPPGGNPDVVLAPVGMPAMPIECYRVDTHGSQDQFSIELEKGVGSLSKAMGLAVGVGVRAHVDPDIQDVPDVLEAIEKMVRVRSVAGRWVTGGVLQGKYQVSVRVAARGRFTRREIDNAFFDMAAEPELMLNAEGRAAAHGQIAFSHAWCVGVRRDWRTVRRQYDQILNGFSAKRDQLRKSCEDNAATGLAGAGLVALRTPRLSASELFDLDRSIRDQLREPGSAHVSGVMLWWDEPERSGGKRGAAPTTSAGRRHRTYQILNPNAVPRLPGNFDSRKEVFGVGREAYSVISPESGALTPTVGKPDDSTPQPQHWPPGAFDDVGILSAAEGSLDVTFCPSEEFWSTHGDLLLAYLRFGRNELRFIRDQHLNLRVVRFGGGVLRDHIALDLRPWRHVLEMKVHIAWQKRLFAVAVPPMAGVAGVYAENRRR